MVFSIIIDSYRKGFVASRVVSEVILLTALDTLNCGKLSYHNKVIILKTASSHHWAGDHRQNGSPKYRSVRQHLIWWTNHWVGPQRPPLHTLSFIHTLSRHSTPFTWTTVCLALWRSRLPVVRFRPTGPVGLR